MIIQEPEENYKTGWIKLFRSIKNHWLWSKGKPLTKLEAWLLILIETNHEDEKCLIGNVLMDCNRGQKLYSLQTWAKLFNWSIQNVRTFFKLLQNDNMINIEGLQNTTRLTVCKYGTYQDSQHATNTQLISKQHTTNKQLTTIKELKKEKNKRIKEKYLDVVYFDKSVKIDEAFKDYLNLRIDLNYTMTDRAINALSNRLREYSNGETKEALRIIDNAILGKWKSFYKDK